MIRPPLFPIEPRFTEVIKIIVLGDGGVGKTALIHRFVTGKFSDQPITIGYGFASKLMRTRDGRDVKLQIWDIAGQPRFRLLVPSAKGGAKGIILMFDVSRESTFVRLEDWVRLAKSGLPPDKHIPIVLVGGKCDLQRSVQTEEARRFSERMKLDAYVEASSKQNLHVGQPFEKLLQLMTSGNAR